MKATLGKTERRFLEALATLSASSRIPPSIRDIAREMCHTGSHSHLCYLRENLEARGYVSYTPKVHRSLLLTEDGERYLAGGDA